MSIYEIIWPTLEEVKSMTDKNELLSTGLMMWGNCCLEKPPDYFGDAMAIIGHKLNVIPTGDNLLKLAKERN